MIYYQGKLVTQLTRFELIEAIEFIVQQYAAVDPNTQDFFFDPTTNPN